MDAEARKAMAVKARVVTLSVNELLNGIEEVRKIIETINNIKYALEELGITQDAVIGAVQDADVENEVKWDDEYDIKANSAIKEGRDYLSEIEVENRPHDKQDVKLNG